MSIASEFPALYAVSKMYPAVLKMIGDNLESYSVDVRIDYERWIQFQEEYSNWAESITSTANGKNIIVEGDKSETHI